jgi:hypothetical protein
MSTDVKPFLETCGLAEPHIFRVGQNHTFIGIYGVYTVFYFCREITIHTVIYGVNIRFWPTLFMSTDVKPSLETCVGLAKTIYIYGVYMVLLAENPPNIRSYR